MSAIDISRFLFQPQKRYSSVRMQQGRAKLDSDWNESERIDDEEARRTLIDILCSKGTSNDGFRISDVSEASRLIGVGGDVEFPFTRVDTFDFRFAEGSFYLGGLRFEADALGANFLNQSDWLQLNADLGGLPTAPAVSDLLDPNGQDRERYDMVYLRGWEQCVTAVEDSELREQALGGPDTSVRVRRMRRLEVLEDTAPGCADAFELLKESLTEPAPGSQSGRPHEFDALSCELVSNARLTVGLSADDITEDPCKPKVEAGFLGAENQTIRVELTSPNRFIWGRDNASPYYRVQVLLEDGQATRIKFLTQPRDQQSQPLLGQAVEIHPWGALLSNDEKVAELQGHLSTVGTSYDPETQSLTLTDPVPQAWLDWLDNPDNEAYQSDRDPDGQKKYFYLRLWTGGSGLATEPDFEFTPGDPVDLTGTGLTVTFSELGLPGDHWIIAARPHTPDVVSAWELMIEAPPAGTRFFFAPLAMIRWSVGGVDVDTGEPRVVGTVHDCRTRFRPLCEIRGCCTVTVGDGRASHGDYQSIQAAVDSLPPEGGEICLLPGVHSAAATIENRRNIRIHGCGKQTLVIPAVEDRNATLFRVIDSHCISITNMDMATISGIAVVVGGTSRVGSTEFEIAHTRILACLEGIRVERGRDIHINANRIRLLDKDGARVGILIAAQDALIERNDIGVVPARQPPPPDDPGSDPDPEDPCEDPERIFGNLPFLFLYLNRVFQPLLPVFATLFRAFRALGGIQLAAGCERVRVLENKINGGAGNGITLGGGVESVLIPEEEDDGPVILSNLPSIRGFLRVDGVLAEHVSLAISREGDTRPAITGSDGFFSVAAPEGEYSLALLSPGFRVNTVRMNRNSEFSHFVIDATRFATAPPKQLAFLYSIRIDANEIRNMGLSGIGTPVALSVIGIDRSLLVNTFSTRALAAVSNSVGNPVIGLQIRRNHITRCLQRSFDDALSRIVRTQGLGGVSLGTVAVAEISGNQIERNGISHVRPVCGVFMRASTEVEVHENRIVDNGPIDPNQVGTTEIGQRGGVVLTAFSAAINLNASGSTADATRPAARIHDNVILQPHGHAVRLIARGAASVCNNRLTTERPEPALRSPSASLSTFGMSAIQYPAGTALVANIGVAGLTNSGTTLFNSNQLRLESPENAITSALLYSNDDVSFSSNQSEVIAPPGANGVVFSNAWVVARTLRTRGNRFREVLPGAKFGLLASLVSACGLRNNSGNNQADHCIFASNQIAAHPAVITDNQIIDTGSCDRFFRVVDFVAGDFLRRFFT